jgi:VIT1/CCC1 family predicted Fe2+/Mn2+ transporter
MNLRRYSFGSTSAIVTSLGIIVGFDVATAPRAAIVAGLLIIGIADNISDSLSIHVYQESENLEGRAALRATLTNFSARLVVALAFVAIVLVVPKPRLVAASLACGLLLLGVLTYLVAHARGVSAPREVAKHLAVAAAVIVVSRLIGAWIASHIR